MKSRQFTSVAITLINYKKCHLDNNMSKPVERIITCVSAQLLQFPFCLVDICCRYIYLFSYVIQTLFQPFFYLYQKAEL